ncbi:MAG: RNA polymerase sigma factor [Sandaracinaceae bacterium]
MSSDAHRAIARVCREETPKLVGRLTRMLRDVGLAEELAQDAMLSALEDWPHKGVPERPGAWLMTTAKNRALNAIQRARMQGTKHEAIGHTLPTHVTLSEVEAALEARMDDDVSDDVLRLIFTSCHPVLSPDARAALTLRLIGGLTTDEIARAYLVPEPTVAQRIVRAKKTIRDAAIPFEVPRGEELGPRLASVLEVVYLIFNEGYTATAGDDLMRPDLAQEAIRLARLLVEVAPAEPEAYGLLALMELHTSRTATRVDADGDPVLLSDQDRARWDELAIHRGLGALEHAIVECHRSATAAGPYVLQASIAACHARAATFEATDWARIAALYEELGQLVRSPVIALNHAVAVSRAEGPAAGLAMLDALQREPALARYHLLPSARADLLARLGRRDEARAEFERAASLTDNARQRERLLARAAEI